MPIEATPSFSGYSGCWWTDVADRSGCLGRSRRSCKTPRTPQDPSFPHWTFPHNAQALSDTRCFPDVLFNGDIRDPIPSLGTAARAKQQDRDPEAPNLLSAPHLPRQAHPITPVPHFPLCPAIPVSSAQLPHTAQLLEASETPRSLLPDARSSPCLDRAAPCPGHCRSSQHPACSSTPLVLASLQSG